MNKNTHQSRLYPSPAHTPHAPDRALCCLQCLLTLQLANTRQQLLQHRVPIIVLLTLPLQLLLQLQLLLLLKLVAAADEAHGMEARSMFL